MKEIIRKFFKLPKFDRKFFNTNYLVVYPSGRWTTVHWTNLDKKRIANFDMHNLSKDILQDTLVFELKGEALDVFPKWKRLKDR